MTLRFLGLARNFDGGILLDETRAYLKLVGGNPNADFISSVDAFIRRGKITGWWTALYWFFLYCGPTLAGCTINLRDSTLLSVGVVNNVTTFNPYVGIKGDAVSIWVNHKFKMGDIVGATASNFFMGEYIAQDIPSAIGEFGMLGGGQTITLRARNGVNANIFSCSGTADSLPVNTAVGSLTQYRGSGSSFIVNKGGGGTTITRTSTGTLPTGQVGVLRPGATSVSFSPDLITAVYGGSDAGFIANADWQQDFAAAFDQLMLGIGAVTPEQLDPTPENTNPPYAFGPTSINSVTPAGLRVYAFTKPPTDSDTNLTFAMFPLTDAVSFQNQQLVAGTWTGGYGNGGLWCNRCNQKTTAKPNGLNPIVRNSGGVQCRTEFTTPTLADGATATQLAYLLGMPAHNGGLTGYLDVANAAGFADSDCITYLTASSYKVSLGSVVGTFVAGETITQSTSLATGVVTGFDVTNGFLYYTPTANPFTYDGTQTVTGSTSSATAFFTGFVSNPDSLFTGTPTNGQQFKVTTNKIILPNAVLANAPARMRRGVVFDYEVGDNRTNAQALAGLTTLSAMCLANGYESILVTDALNSGTLRISGVDVSNLYQIHQMFNWLNIVVSPLSVEHDATATIQNQLALLTGPLGNQPITYSKLMMAVGIGPHGGELSSSDATKTRTYITGNGTPANAFGALLYVNLYGTPGGAISRPYNQVKAIVAGLPTS